MAEEEVAALSDDAAVLSEAALSLASEEAAAEPADEPAEEPEPPHAARLITIPAARIAARIRFFMLSFPFLQIWFPRFFASLLDDIIFRFVQKLIDTAMPCSPVFSCFLQDTLFFEYLMSSICFSFDKIIIPVTGQIRYQIIVRFSVDLRHFFIFFQKYFQILADNSPPFRQTDRQHPFPDAAGQSAMTSVMFLLDYFLKMFPVRSRCCADILLKCRAEVAVVIEAQTLSDVADRKGCIHEKVLRLPDSSQHDITDRRQACPVPHRAPR